MIESAGHAAHETCNYIPIRYGVHKPQGLNRVQIGAPPWASVPPHTCPSPPCLRSASSGDRLPCLRLRGGPCAARAARSPHSPHAARAACEALVRAAPPDRSLPAPALPTPRDGTEPASPMLVRALPASHAVSELLERERRSCRRHGCYCAHRRAQPSRSPRRAPLRLTTLRSRGAPQLGVRRRLQCSGSLRRCGGAAAATRAGRLRGACERARAA